MTTTTHPTPVLGCTGCQHLFIPTAVAWSDLASTGCPRCGGWTWLASLSDPAMPDPSAPIATSH